MRPTSGALPYHVKRARDYIHRHAGEKIALADLAAEAGCGYRNLQLAFEEAFGPSPMD
ncbi:AraC family transcriptional regulator [Algihabitans albus]|uniref:AraC family transcriptional regulator n=1 Tax=Algihabitans albus TaxID=2164067 RepID=UPI000E5D7A30|nr:AraC family transcriptional regulator [Algihabitans albus]